MLSILIPTYNYNVFPLAKTIEKQAIQIGIDFEIIAIDDGSASPLNIENEKINTLKNGKFIAKKENVGLSQNRNNLAELAKQPYLLFIDGDSEIIKPNYLFTYLESIKKKPDVVYGGRKHPNEVIPERKLRWKYGKHHEDTTAAMRKKSIYRSVLFNNTLISKVMFDSIYFNKNITTYGHEDTIFAYQLHLKKANVIHIDNRIMHGDVDFNAVFFKKTHKSVENLNYIYKNKIIEKDFITFLVVFSKLEKFGLNYFLSASYFILKPIFQFNLTSKHPFLFLFNMFRISYFCNINLKKL